MDKFNKLTPGQLVMYKFPNSETALPMLVTIRATEAGNALYLEAKSGYMVKVDLKNQLKNITKVYGNKNVSSNSSDYDTNSRQVIWNKGDDSPKMLDAEVETVALVRVLEGLGHPVSAKDRADFKKLIGELIETLAKKGHSVNDQRAIVRLAATTAIIHGEAALALGTDLFL